MPSPLWVRILSILIFLGVCPSFAQEKGQPVEKSVPAFRFEADEQVTVDVALHVTADGIPVYYFAHLETDVCSDELCKPVDITIRWDLLGRFLSYHTDEAHALTKFDHVKLTEEDHAQLHRILSDTASILRDYQVEDMIDTTKQVRSQQVDAVTRPTSLTFDGATVEGALYTVYTLWHFTNGPIRARIKAFTTSLMSDDAIVKNMLTSENRDYVGFVFKNITEKQRHRLEDVIVKLVGSKDAYIPHFALAQLRDSVISLPNYQQQLLTYFPQVDNSVKNALLDRLSSIRMNSDAMIKLLATVSNLRENQILKAFTVVQNNKAHTDEKIRKQLEILSRNQNSVIAQQAKNTLLKIE